MQVVPEGVDEVDGVVSGIGIGVTREQDWKHETSAFTRKEKKPNIVELKQQPLSPKGLTKGDVSDVVPDSGVRVLQLQRGLPVAEQHLWGGVAGSSPLFEFLQTDNT